MDVMQLRRNLMMMQKSGLPSEYQQIDWIGGTGTQYIDTGIECTSDLALKFKFSSSTTENNAICGGINMQDAPTYYRNHCTPRGVQLGYYYQYNTNSYANIQANNTWAVNAITEVDINPSTGICIVNGTYNFNFTAPSNKTTGKSYGILARISDTGEIQAKESRFYYFQFFRNSQMIGNFIPCIRISDSEPGMYDTVGRQFHANAGTGTLVIPS